MKLVIAEKPSVGMALANALGVTGKKNGYVEGDDYIISWCVGHLISRLTDDIIAAAKSEVDESKITPRTGGEVIGVCPRCGKNVVVSPKAYSCEDRNCGFTIWKNDRFFETAKKPLTKEMVTALLKSGKIAVKGLYSPKSGRNYDATVCLNDTGKYVNFRLEFAPRKVKGGKG